MKRRCGLLGILMILLAGCLGPINTPDMTTYTLENIVKPQGQRPKTQRILLVTMPQAAAGFDSRRIAYVERPGVLAYYSKHQWIAPLPQLLLPLMVQSVENTGVFLAVVGSPYTGLSDYQLDSQLQYLVQRFDKQQHRSTIDAALSVRLLSRQGSRVVASKTLLVSLPVKGKDNYAAFTVTRQVVNQLLVKLNRFVIDTVGR